MGHQKTNRAGYVKSGKKLAAKIIKMLMAYFQSLFAQCKLNGLLKHSKINRLRNHAKQTFASDLHNKRKARCTSHARCKTREHGWYDDNKAVVVQGNEMGLHHYTQEPLKYHINVSFYTKYTHPTHICRGISHRGTNDQRSQNSRRLGHDRHNGCDWHNNQPEHGGHSGGGDRAMRRDGDKHQTKLKKNCGQNVTSADTMTKMFDETITIVVKNLGT